jgi:hypothetical protein
LPVRATILTATPTSFALNGPGVIRITERQVGGGRVDVGRHGASIGDVQVLRELLYNKCVTPNPIGHAELICIYTGTFSRDCAGTFFLPKGRLMVSGPLRYRQFFELAVVGGTVCGAKTLFTPLARPICRQNRVLAPDTLAEAATALPSDG